MPRFLVHPPHGASSFLVDGESQTAVEAHFAPFAEFRVWDAAGDRTGWPLNFNLDALAEHSLYTLGMPEPSSLSNMLDHLVNGDVYRWYELVERSTDGGEHRLGRLGSWVPKGPGSLLLLPGPRRLSVAVVRPAEPPLEAELVLVA